MTRILITGASGLLGGSLAQDFAGQHTISGVYHSQRLVISGVRMIGADLTIPQLVARVMGKVQPEIVIHCAAATDVDRCQSDPDWAWRLNRDMAADVAAQARQVGARTVHISTDAVFDGETGGYDEEAEPRPLNVYAESKLAGEQAVLEANPEALVVRTNLFGLPLAQDRRGLMAWFLRRLGGGDTAPGFRDVWFSPISVLDLGSWLLGLVEAGGSGVIHVGGGRCLSKLEFGRAVAEVFGYQPERVVEASIEDADLAAPRPRNLCLDSSRAAARLGRQLPPLRPALEAIRRRAASGEQVTAGERG